MFANDTVFTPITENIPATPHNKFNFIEFEQLWSRVNVNEVLSDNIFNSLYSFRMIIILNSYTNHLLPFFHIKCN